MVEIDLDGNIIWIRGEDDNSVTLLERATFSSEFMQYVKESKVDLSLND